MKCRKAFTLIELLVVISIIALLLSIIMPALKKAKDAGRRVICLTNQKQIMLAIETYAHDNDQWFPVFNGSNWWEGIDGSLLKENYVESPTLFQCPSDQADFGPIDQPILSNTLTELNGGVDVYIDERTPENYRTYGYNMNSTSWEDGGAGWKKTGQMKIPQKTILIIETPNIINVLYQNHYDCNFGPVPANMKTTKGKVSGYTHWSGYDIWAASRSETFVHKKGCDYGFADGHAEYIIVDIPKEWPPFVWFDNGLFKGTSFGI